MTRDGRASLSWSKKSNSTPVAVREKRLKFTPPSAIVAPSGKLRPIPVAEFISLFRPTLARFICPFARPASISLPPFASRCKRPYVSPMLLGCVAALPVGGLDAYWPAGGRSAFRRSRPEVGMSTISITMV